jgi:hypothetical protein
MSSCDAGIPRVRRARTFYRIPFGGRSETPTGRPIFSSRGPSSRLQVISELLQGDDIHVTAWHNERFCRSPRDRPRHAFRSRGVRGRPAILPAGETTGVRDDTHGHLTAAILDVPAFAICEVRPAGFPLDSLHLPTACSGPARGRRFLDRGPCESWLPADTRCAVGTSAERTETRTGSWGGSISCSAVSAWTAAVGGWEVTTA